MTINAHLSGILALVVSFGLPVGHSCARAQSGASPVLAAAKAELDRDFAALSKEPVPAYYLSYEIIDTHSAAVTSSFGALLHSAENHRRVGHVDLRVGDYALDNTHQLRGKMVAPNGGIVTLPVDDDPLPLREALWVETDRRYKKAQTQLAAVETNNEVKLAQEDKSADFSARKARAGG